MAKTTKTWTHLGWDRWFTECLIHGAKDTAILFRAELHTDPSFFKEICDAVSFSNGDSDLIQWIMWRIINVDPENEVIKGAKASFISINYRPIDDFGEKEKLEILKRLDNNSN
jgi:hypothetical protein